MDPLEAQMRQVYFFDTPDLALEQERRRGARPARQRRGDDTVVKLRPVVPTSCRRAARLADFGVEVDAMPAASSARGR